MKHLIEPLLEKYTDEGVRNVLKTCVLFDLNELSGLWRIRKTGDFIYFLIDNNEIKYIGKTIKIEERIKSHKKNKPKFEFALFCRVKKGNLDDLERFLINKATPPWNKQFPVCKNIDTNNLTYPFDPSLESQEEIEHRSLMYRIIMSMDEEEAVSSTEKKQGTNVMQHTKWIGIKDVANILSRCESRIRQLSITLNDSKHLGVRKSPDGRRNWEWEESLVEEAKGLDNISDLITKKEQDILESEIYNCDMSIKSNDLTIVNMQRTIDTYITINQELKNQIIWLQGQVEFLQQHIVK
jgi:hypothetical protein